MGAADSARANPNYWPAGNFMGPDVFGQLQPYPTSNGGACYVPMTVPPYSYITSIGLPFLPLSGASGTVSFAIYGGNAQYPTVLWGSEGTATIPPAGGVASVSIASPGYQNQANSHFWVGFQFSNATGQYFGIQEVSYPGFGQDPISPGAGTTSGFVLPTTGGPTILPTFNSTAYCVQQSYGAWPLTPPSGGNFSLGSSFFGAGVGIVPYIVLGH
jgi:hypothetical protein